MIELKAVNLEDSLELEKEWNSHLVEAVGKENLEEFSRMLSREYSLEHIYDKNELVGKLFSKKFGGVFNIVVYLLKKVRGKGVGILLLQRIEDYCRENGFHRLEIETLEDCNVVDYYKKRGFDTIKIPNSYFGKTLYICSRDFKE